MISLFHVVISGPHFSEYLYFTVTEDCTVMLACKVTVSITQISTVLITWLLLELNKTSPCVRLSGGQCEEGDDLPLVQRGRWDRSRNSSQCDVRSLRSSHPSGNFSSTLAIIASILWHIWVKRYRQSGRNVRRNLIWTLKIGRNKPSTPYADAEVTYRAVASSLTHELTGGCRDNIGLNQLLQENTHHILFTRRNRWTRRAAIWRKSIF